MKSLFVMVLIGFAGAWPAVVRAEAFPATVVSQFVNQCESSFQSQIPALASKGGNYCRCVIQELQRKLTLAEFTSLADGLSTTNAASVGNETLVTTAQTCMAQTLQ